VVNSEVIKSDVIKFEEIKPNPSTLHVDLPHDFPHGGGVEAAAQAWQCDVADVLDLSTGLHPAGESAWLSEWMREHAALVAHYPDAHGEPARSALAGEFAVPPGNILITAGAQATIEVIFQAMGWQSMAIEVPCYNEPIRCAKRAACDVLAFESGSPPAADMLWLTSPSNPSGETRWPHADECVSEYGHSQMGHPQPHTICLDESYMPFAQRRRLGLMPDVIRIGSLTKTFCIPGLRLGYVIADRETIAKLRQWMPPWPSSTLALHLLPELLPEADPRDEQIIIARVRLQRLLKSYGWQVRPSAASFLMARPANDVMPDFTKHSILLRYFPEWPQLHGWIRFGLPGNESDWQRLKNAITCRI